MSFIEEKAAIAARELVSRHGLDGAKDIVRRRASRCERQGSWPDHDLAVLLLTALERLSAQRLPAQRSPAMSVSDEVAPRSSPGWETLRAR